MALTIGESADGTGDSGTIILKDVLSSMTNDGVDRFFFKMGASGRSHICKLDFSFPWSPPSANEPPPTRSLHRARMQECKPGDERTGEWPSRARGERCRRATPARSFP